MDETEVSAALRNGHYSRVKKVFPIPLAHKRIVKNLPMLGPRMHPACFQAIFLLEDCVRNGKCALTAELEKEATIVITVTNAVSTKHSYVTLTIKIISAAVHNKNYVGHRRI